MAALCRICGRKPASITTVARIISARYASFSDDDLPGPYPQTPQERAAAAKKYGMRVEDYEPYPDDGLGWGDYPKHPNIHEDEKDPHADWDFPEERRNFGEPLHIEQDLLSRARPNVYSETLSNISVKKQAMMLGAVLGSLGLLFWFGQNYKNFQPVGPKQFPYSNLWVEKGNKTEDCPEVKHYVI